VAPWWGDACGGLLAAVFVVYSPVDGGGVAEGGKKPPRWRWLLRPWLRRPWHAPAAAGEGEMDGDGSTGGHADGAGGVAEHVGGSADGAGGLDDVAATAAAVASAAQPLPPSLSPNVAATGLRVSWRARRQRPVEPWHHLFGPHRSCGMLSPRGGGTTAAAAAAAAPSAAAPAAPYVFFAPDTIAGDAPPPSPSGFGGGGGGSRGGGSGTTSVGRSLPGWWPPCFSGSRCPPRRRRTLPLFRLVKTFFFVSQVP